MRRVQSAICIEPSVPLVAHLYGWVVLVDGKPHILLDLATSNRASVTVLLQFVDAHEVLPIFLTSTKLGLIELANTYRRVEVHPNIRVFLKLVNLGPMLLILEVQISLVIQLDV